MDEYFISEVVTSSGKWNLYHTTGSNNTMILQNLPHWKALAILAILKSR